MPPPRDLTPDELQQWADHHVPEAEALRWYVALHDLCGPPTTHRWGLPDGETPSQCALAYALYWLHAFGTPDFAGAEPWLPHFPAPYEGAELAAQWRAAGWGAPGNPVRTIEAAGALARTGAGPGDADPWLAAGFTPQRAAKHLAAHVTLKEAAKQDYDDATLDLLAGLQTRH